MRFKSKIKIYNNQHLYFILQGGNVAMFDMKKKMVRHETALHFLSHLSRVFVPEIPPETDEYNHVLDQYKEMINRLPLMAKT